MTVFFSWAIFRNRGSSSLKVLRFFIVNVHVLNFDSIFRSDDISTASNLTQISFTEEDEFSLYGEKTADDAKDSSTSLSAKKVDELFPLKGVDALNDGTPLDLRTKNSWTARLHEVFTTLRISFLKVVLRFI